MENFDAGCAILRMGRREALRILLDFIAVSSKPNKLSVSLFFHSSKQFWPCRVFVRALVLSSVGRTSF
jgi:hypothetical protein